MRIAVTSAVSWPYLRRGSRFAYELAAYLAGRGHEVTYISTKPGDLTRKRTERGMKVEYHRFRKKPFMTMIGCHKLETFLFPCLGSLLKGDFDIVQTTFQIDALAASLNRSLKGTPFAHVIFDCKPLHFPTFLGRPAFRRIVRTASRLVAVSHFVNQQLKEEYGRAGDEIPLTADLARFQPGYIKDLSPPRILCTASLLEKRKRVDLLVKAFEKLLPMVPDAVLQLNGHTTPRRNEELLLQVSPETRRSIEILGVGRCFGDDLPTLYRQAAISVLPSINEAFGMVQAESLAAGTPVVATRSGACPEILSDPGIGVLFEPESGPEEVRDALLKGLKLARDPATPARCRRHAQRYSWETVGPRFESLYEEILAGDGPRGGRVRPSRGQVAVPAAPPGKTSSPTGALRSSSRERLFLDVLDSQDIPYDVYGEVDTLRPRVLAVMACLEKRGLRRGTALVAAPLPLPFSMVLGALGFSVREQRIQISRSAALDDVPGSFDLIVCDDLLQHWTHPVGTIGLLGRKLGPGGILLLMTPNVARGTTRLRLAAGKNIYPLPASEPACGEADGIGPRILPYREYTAGEVASMVAAAGLATLERRTILGRQPVLSHWYPLSLSSYLLRQGYGLAQRLFPPLRSYLLVAAANPSPGIAPRGS